jgi:glycosidase
MPAAPTNDATKPLGALEGQAVPAWLHSAVIYEIFPRSFSPAGDLNGVTRKLDELQKLGVNVLWLMPLHPVGQVEKKGTDGSPYAVRDYYAINPSYGTKEDLHRLIDEAHRRQMKVIIDIVANHTSFDSVMMSHPEFYKHDAKGKVLSPYDWTDVAALDYTNPALRRYMTDMLVYWVKDFHLDGLRCDAAGEVPTDFWEQARKELDRAHPDLLMLAEASKPELMRSAFNLDYSWPLMATLNEVIEHGAPASTVKATLDQEQKLFPKHSMHMRMFDDHDEQRALARYGIGGSLAAAALVFTTEGVPMIYSGMEVGDPTESGAPALFEPLKVWWQAGEMRREYPQFYRFIIALRKEQAALRVGETIWLHNSDEAHVVTYVRHTADQEILVAVNLSSTPFRGTVEASGEGWKEFDIPRRKDTAAVEPQRDALPALSLDAFQARILHRHLNVTAPPEAP